MSGPFSAGHLQDPRPDDKRFDDVADADRCAMDGSYDDSVWAVWDDDGGEVLAVVYQQQMFVA